MLLKRYLLTVALFYRGIMFSVLPDQIANYMSVKNGSKTALYLHDLWEADFSMDANLLRSQSEQMLANLVSKYHIKV